MSNIEGYSFCHYCQLVDKEDVNRVKKETQQNKLLRNH